ncbi:MAG: hypothetical protein K0S93_65 [Nitrososphaeraceae archaeon]|jgi:transposase-like protein|nr:hypothetical protein [Nitrososphaeraceae archaeon]
MINPTFKPKCPKCDHFMVKAGFNVQVKKGKLQRYKCQKCGSIRLESSKCLNCNAIILGEKIGI